MDPNICLEVTFLLFDFQKFRTCKNKRCLMAAVSQNPWNPGYVTCIRFVPYPKTKKNQTHHPVRPAFLYYNKNGGKKEVSYQSKYSANRGGISKKVGM